MGIAEYFIYRKFKEGKKEERLYAKAGLVVYNIQLAFNFIWTPIFFNAELYWVAFAILAVMCALIIALVCISFRTSKTAFWCLLPYLLWTTFAGYLNVAIAILN